MRISDWSSDVCSSDLIVHRRARGPGADALTPPVISAQQPAPAQHRRRQRARGGDQIGAPALREMIPRRLHRTVGGAERLHELRSEEHTSELQSLMRISYAVFCLKKKKQKTTNDNTKYTNKMRHS